MSRLISILLISIIIPAFFSVLSYAGQGESRSLNALTDLKRELGQLLQENQKLERSYSIIQNQYNNLKVKHGEYAPQIDRWSKTRKQQDKMKIQRRSQMDQWDNQVNSTGDQVLVLKTQMANLNIQLADMDERLRLLKLKASELMFEQADIQLEKKLNDTVAQEKLDNEQRQLTELKKQYELIVEREKDLLVDIKKIDTDGNTYDDKAIDLKVQNDHLRSKIDQLKYHISFKKKENELLRNKKLYELRLSENQTWKYDKMNNELGGRVNQLEDEISMLDTAVSSSLEEQTQKRQILNAFIETDSENQKLKDKLYELEQKIKGLEKS